MDILENGSWLPESRRALLATTRELRTELGTRSSVPTVSIFGYGLKTVTKSASTATRAGFAGASVQSANWPGTAAFPKEAPAWKELRSIRFARHHGVMFVDSDVQKRLKLELTRRFNVNV